MSNLTELTAAHIRYLLTLKRLYKETGIKSVDVANVLSRK